MMEFRNYSDNKLLSLIIQGHQGAFAEIYSRHWGFMFVHAMKMLSDEDQAKDIVQEVFISIWNKTPAISPDVNLSAYLFTSVRNKVLNALRNEKVREDYESLFSLYVEECSNSPLDIIHEKELLEIIETVIDSLPDKMKMVFELSRKDYLSHKEIAERMNISEKTVKRQVSNALKIIRTKINRPEELILAAIFLNHVK